MTTARGWPWELALVLAVSVVYLPVWWVGTFWDDALVATLYPV